jgi:ADP-ribose pyrophosphatase
VINLRVDTVEIAQQGYKKREIIEHGGAVGIVAITDDKKVVLIKQFRKAVEEVLLEIPAGKLEIGENPKDCAKRELKEETGYDAVDFKLIHKFYTSPGFSNQKVYIYLATGLTKGTLEKYENVEVSVIDYKEVYDMVFKNEIIDAKTSLGLLLAKELI